MKIEIGPVSRASALAWLDYAAAALGDLRAAPGSPIPAHALDGFADFLEEWRAAAAAPGPFRWTGERTPEQVEFMIRALYQGGQVIEREHRARRAPLRPHAADEFHVVLVECVLRALEHEGPSNAQFVAALRDEWEIARRL